MSSLSRRAILLTLPLAACGFTPAYGPQGASRALIGRVEVAAPKDRNGFDLVKQLELRLGRPSGAIYAMDYTIRTQKISLGVTPSGDITRYNLVGSVDWTLKDIAGGQVIAKGSVDNFTGWSATGSTVAEQTAQTDAASRLMRILADQIVTRLNAAAASGWPA